MTISYDRWGIQAHLGNCIDVMRGMEPESISAILTDPPYGLAELPTEKVAKALTEWVSGDREYIPAGGKGFMSKSWDRFVPPPAAWDECYRVMKPGAYMLVFAGTRTADLMGISIRLAGFTLKDTIQWVYASGMPKGLNIGKAIDRQRDDNSDILRVTTWLAGKAAERGVTRVQVDLHMGTSDMGGWWLSTLRHRCAIPQWDQWVQLRELIGFGDDMDTEVWRLNGRKGTPGEAWDQREVVGRDGRQARSSWLGTQDGVSSTWGIGDWDVTAPATDAAKQWDGWNTALKPSQEPIIVAQKPFKGTISGNVLKHGTGGLNIGACRVPTTDRWTATGKQSAPGTSYQGSVDGSFPISAISTHPDGRWPANVVFSHSEDCAEDSCVDECPVAELDRQSGVTTSNASAGRNGKDQAVSTWGLNRVDDTVRGHDDSGGASRFFPCFRYEAKAPGAERPRIAGKSHSTVKPVSLLRFLSRLITPPSGTILDCFAGTGSTGQAARAEGFPCILIDDDLQAMEWIRARLDARPKTEAPTPDEVLIEQDGDLLDLLDLLGDDKAVTS